MLDWDKLRVFYAVAQAESLTRAGESLNLSQSAVSRQISTLEDQLSVALFHRHARGLILTEQGEILYKTAAEMSRAVRATQTSLMDSRERPRGPLVVAAPHALATMWLVPHLAEFQQLYPEITITLHAGDAEVNVAMREADCAIQVHEATSPDVIQRRITTIHSDLYASNDYLRKHGIPRHIEDLKDHQMIAYGQSKRAPFSDVDWSLRLNRKTGETLKPIIKINTLIGILRAVEQGMGIAGLPDYISRDARDISPVLPTVKGPALDTYFVYSIELRNSKRTMVFRDFLLRKFANTEF